MRYIPIALLAAGILSGCVDKDLGSQITPVAQATIPLDSDKALWLKSDIPQVGTVLQFVYKDGKLLRVINFGSTMIAGHVPLGQPAMLTEAKHTITSKGGVDVAATFLGAAAPDLKFSLSKSKTVTVDLKNVSIEQYQDQNSFLTAIQALDSGPKSDNTTRNAWGTLRSIVTSEQATVNASSYRPVMWIVTKVYTGDNVTFSYSKDHNITFGGNCGSSTAACKLLPLQSLVPSFNSSGTNTGSMDATKRPVFVTLEPLKRNTTNGTLQLVHDYPQPSVIGQ